MVTGKFFDILERKDLRFILNIYLDGYIGKLTTKKWAKIAKTSPDTAARDIKQLTEAGILIPQEGKLRI